MPAKVLWCVLLLGTVVLASVAGLPEWSIMHALEGVGLGETVHAARGWDALTVSAQQEFAAACDAEGVLCVRAYWASVHARLRWWLATHYRPHLCLPQVACGSSAS